MSNHIFVYGTLKTGQCREISWPRKPIHIRSAWTHGRLYDTGPFPAMTSGGDRVAGELWSFRQSDVELTLQVLDQIEGTNQPGHPNEYDRDDIRVYLMSGGSLAASAYIYARTERLPKFTYLHPEFEIAGIRYAIWPRHSPWKVS